MFTIQQPVLNMPKRFGQYAFVRVEGGIFSMGAAKADFDNELPQHTVAVETFYMSKYPVTQSLWAAVMGGTATDSQFPAQKVSWDDTRTLLDRLLQDTELSSWLSGLGSGVRLRLPYEAEWEYAAGGGSQRKGYPFAGGSQLDKLGWYEGNSGGQPSLVGKKQANELGLHDMSGLVWEWCEDWYGHDYYRELVRSGQQQAVYGPESGQFRVLRGGSYQNSPVHCRISRRGRSLPGLRSNDVGLRLVIATHGMGS
jgi:formylglycine-generating enzyme required for sulfatase activity